MLNILGKKYLFLIASGILVLASVISVLIWGLKPGIDFTGGSLLEIEYKDARPDLQVVKKNIEPLDIGNVTVQFTGERGALLRFKHIDEAKHIEIIQVLGGSEKVAEKRFDTIGPTIGEELKRRSILAIVLAIIGIVLYITFVFRQVSRPVSSWKYGVVTIWALIHDVMIPIGIFSILGHFRNVEVDTLFITALLTILGFSVHDTIVVFDRIRENLRKLKVAETYETTVNRSINETLTRSINTSLTVLIILLAIFFFGGETTRYFALALIFGIIFGTYSSIFVASPLLVIWHNLTKKR